MSEHGRLPEFRYLFYLSTTLVIAFCLKTNLGFGGVVAIQLFINIFATGSFYYALQKKPKAANSAFFTVLALIACVPFQTWNFYLYTESIFYSSVLLFFSSCIGVDKLSLKNILLQFLLLVLTIVSRPLGILLLPCWIVFLISKVDKKSRPAFVLAAATGVIILCLISNVILGSISDWQILKPAENGYVICEIPTEQKLDLASLRNRPPLYQLFAYVTSYPLEFFDLAVKRIRAFFFLTRPYYSTTHNLALGTFCIGLYLPVLINLVLWFRRRINSNLFFPFAIVLFFSIAVSLQCADYHNRFQNAIIPVFLYLGVFVLCETSLPLRPTKG